MSNYSAIDMTTAAAQGFRDGVASVANSAIPNNQDASAAQPAPVVPEGWNIQRVFNPSGYTIQMPSGGFIRITDHGGGGVETAFCQFVAALLSAAPAQGQQV